MTKSVLIEKVSERVDGLTRNRPRSLWRLFLRVLRRPLHEERNRAQGVREFQTEAEETQDSTKPEDRREGRCSLQKGAPFQSR